MAQASRWRWSPARPTCTWATRARRSSLPRAGARLIDGHAETLQYKTLKPSKIRGVDSEGMVCSEKELGISDEHDGHHHPARRRAGGHALVDYWGDTVLDIELTPNLARCLSHRRRGPRGGRADRRSAHADRADACRPTGAPIAGQIEIEIADPDLCPRYSAALIKGVQDRPLAAVDAAPSDPGRACGRSTTSWTSPTM